MHSLTRATEETTLATDNQRNLESEWSEAGEGKRLDDSVHKQVCCCAVGVLGHTLLPWLVSRWDPGWLQSLSSSLLGLCPSSLTEQNAEYRQGQRRTSESAE